MSVRKVLFASVCSALLAALAAVPASHAAAQSPSALADAAYKALSKGDTTTAIAQYSTAIESRDLKPATLANSLLNRGLAYQQAGQFEQAINDYSSALRIDALSAKLRATSLFNRGLAYQKLIFEIKGNRGSAAMLAFIESLLSKYRIDSFIVGCSELHIVAKRLNADPARAKLLGCVDPFAILARDWAEGRFGGIR